MSNQSEDAELLVHQRIYIKMLQQELRNQREYNHDLLGNQIEFRHRIADLERKNEFLKQLSTNLLRKIREVDAEFDPLKNHQK